MPKIDWIGKGAVVRHHLAVPYRLLHCNGRLSAGDADSGNLLVQGDNLEALRALLPYYAGRVKCVYIDPPYNTGNEGWKYNDKVNSPQIRRWLNKTVGGEADDLCRHDKWLCMMYPRLRLLRDFLRDDGVIFVSIDDNEQHRLRMLMDEIFGANNVDVMIWKKTGSGRDGKMKNVKTFRKDHEYIMVAYKSVNKLDKMIKIPNFKNEYGNADNDPRGAYKQGSVSKKEIASSSSHRNYYTVIAPGGKSYTREFDMSQDEFNRFNDDNRIYWGKTGNSVPRIKIFLNEPRATNTPSVLEWGTTTEAKEELKEIFSQVGEDFPTPKPMELIKTLIQISTDKNSLIMDSFAGSGTTGHAVLQQNKEDGGNRQFILVEMDKEISETITAKRIQKAIRGYKSGDKNIAPLGGGVRFCTLGTPLFDENGNIGTEVKFNDLAAHVFFSHTGSPIPKKTKTALLGEYGEQAIYLLYNGIMGDKSKNGGNILTSAILSKLPPPSDKTMRRVIYGEGVLLSKERLARENIDFRQIPYHIKMR